MFGWYRGATKCYVYLADVSTRQQDISDSPGWKLVVRQGGWFTRGWTFQELTAPAIVRFFSKESERVEEKRFLQQNVSDSPGWKLAFRQSRWFTRGWTLQELIAPTIVEFFSKEGLRVGDKKSLEQEIHNITGIPLKALQGDPLSNFSVPERMAWIKRRDTKYEEDKAYSLFGIFDVHIPVLYGEGKQKAFDRLREKVDKDSRRLASL